MNGIVYLACPYSDQTKFVRQSRVRVANQAAGILSGQGVRVFNPLGHSQGIVDNGGTIDHEYWMDIDKAMLAASSAMVVLTTSGWDKSRGIGEEVAIAREAGIPIYFLEPTILENKPSCVADKIRSLLETAVAAN